MRVWVSIAIVGLLTLASADAGAEKLAIVVSDQVNVGPDDAYRYADELGLVLQKTEKIQVMKSQQVRPILAAQNPAPTCYLDPACLRELGRRLGVSELMVLHVVKIAGQVQLDSTWYELGAGRASARGSLSFKDNPGDRALALEQKGGGLRPGGVVADTGGDINLGLWISGGATAALLVGWLTTGLIAINTDGKADDCAKREPPPGDMPVCDGDRTLDQITEDRDSQALISDILGITTGVAAASTIFFYYYGKSDESDRSEVGFAPTNGGASVSWTLRF